MHHFSSYISENIKILSESFLQEKYKTSSGQKNAKYIINGFLEFTKKSPESMNESDILNYREYLKIDRQNRKDTILAKFRVIRSYFRYLDSHKEQYQITKEFENLLSVLDISAQDVQVKDKNVLPIWVVKSLFFYLEDTGNWQLRLAAELAARYGLTISRILRLKQSDLYQTDDIHYIRVTERSDRMKKNIGLRNDTVELFLKACSPGGEDIFTSSSGKPLSLRRIEQQLSDAGKAVCAIPVTFNKLRNTCISYLLVEGATYEEISFMTGSPSSMLFRYRNYTGKLAVTALKYKGIN